MLFVICVSCLSLLYCLVCSLQPCGHLLGKNWSLGFLVADVFLCVCHFPIWCPGSGVVLDLSIPDLCHLPYSLIFAFFLTYIEKTKKNIFLFQTTRPTDLIFGKVVLNQICSNNGSVAMGSHLYSENKQSFVNHLVGRFMFERIHSTKEGRNIEQKSGCLSHSKT